MAGGTALLRVAAFNGDGKKVPAKEAFSVVAAAAAAQLAPLCTQPPCHDTLEPI